MRAKRTRETIDPLDVTRAVVVAHVLFTAGNVLSTGGFLYFFVNALGPSGTLLTLLMITPEMSETAALFARPVIAWMGSRKKTWLVFTILARVAALGIPLMAFDQFRSNDQIAIWIIIAALALSHVCRAIAYVSYISWISDVVPKENWGQFFALRRIANLVTMLSVPVGASMLRDDWRGWTDNDAVQMAYVSVFLIGGALILLSAIPLLRVPDVPVQWTQRSPRLLDVLANVWTSKPLRFVVLSSFWLAFFQGLTQSLFFLYAVRALGISLSVYFLLPAVMNLVQLPLSGLGGLVLRSSRGQVAAVHQSDRSQWSDGILDDGLA